MNQKEDPPAPATNTDPDIARYLNVRSAAFPAFIGNDRLAFLTDVTGLPQLWQTRLPGPDQEPHWPDQLTFADDRVLGVWSPPEADRRSLIFTRDSGGNENGQLWHMDPDSGAERCLTRGFDEAMHIFGCWSADGRHYLFSANRRHPGLFDLYRGSLDGPAEMVWQNDRPGFIYHVAWSAGGHRAILSLMHSSFDCSLLEIDLPSGSARRLNPPDIVARYVKPFFISDGRLLLVTDLNRDFMYLAYLDLDSMAFQELVALDWDVHLTALSPDRRWLAYTVNKDGHTELRLRDLADGREQAADLRPAPGVVGMMDWHLTFSPNSRRLAFSYTAGIRTSDCYIWSLHPPAVSAVPLLVTRSSHAGLDPATFTRPSLIHYPTFDQDDHGQARQIPAWLYSGSLDPDRPRPVVVLVHGGPEAQFQPYFNPLVQYLSAQGYALLAPNVRGSTGYGKDATATWTTSKSAWTQSTIWPTLSTGCAGNRASTAGGSPSPVPVTAALWSWPPWPSILICGPPASTSSASATSSPSWKTPATIAAPIAKPSTAGWIATGSSCSAFHPSTMSTRWRPPSSSFTVQMIPVCPWVKPSSWSRH